MLAMSIARTIAGKSVRVSGYSEGSSILRGVEVFATGVHRGKEYTTRDLDKMVANFRKSSTGKNPRLRVPMAVPRLMPGAPAVLGHEEEQKILEGSDLPAAGWPIALWREGHTLKADIDGVAPVVAKCVKHRRYRHVSAEVYDEPPEGVPGEGKTLRRIAFLGADVPQVKTLAELPMPESSGRHSERFASYNPILFRFSEFKPSGRYPGCYTCFFEVSPMNPLEQLQQLGWDTTGMESMEPEELAACLRNAQSMQGSQQVNNDDGTMPPDPNEPMSDLARFADGDLPDADGDEQAQQYADAARKMAERAKMMMEKYCGMGQQQQPMSDDPMGGMATDGVMADGTMPPAPVPGSPPMHHPAPGMPGKPHPKQVTMKYAEEIQKVVDATVAAAVAKITKEFAATKQQAQELADNTRRANIEKFCETQFNAGRVLPPQREAVIARLMRADPHAKAVHKFNEGGKVVSLTLSELELQMREIEKGPVLIKFGEKVKHAPHESGENEKATLKAHYESFRESYHKAGMTEEAYLKAYDSQLKRNPELTAEEYLSQGRKAS